MKVSLKWFRHVCADPVHRMRQTVHGPFAVFSDSRTPVQSIQVLCDDSQPTRRFGRRFGSAIFDHGCLWIQRHDRIPSSWLQNTSETVFENLWQPVSLTLDREQSSLLSDRCNFSKPLSPCSSAIERSHERKDVEARSICWPEHDRAASLCIGMWLCLTKKHPNFSKIQNVRFSSKGLSKNRFRYLRDIPIDFSFKLTCWFLASWHHFCWLSSELFWQQTETCGELWKEILDLDHEFVDSLWIRKRLSPGAAKAKVSVVTKPSIGMSSLFIPLVARTPGIPRERSPECLWEDHNACGKTSTVAAIYHPMKNPMKTSTTNVFHVMKSETWMNHWYFDLKSVDQQVLLYSNLHRDRK